MKTKKTLLLCTMLSVALGGCGTVTSENSSSTNDESSPVIDSSESLSESTTISSSSKEESSLNSSSVSSSNSQVTDSSSSSLDSTGDIVGKVNENFEFETFGLYTPTVEKMAELPSYTPNTIDVSTYKSNTTKLSEGVDLVKVEYKLTSGGPVNPYCIVVDLTKANIVAGSYNNSVSPSTYAKLSTPVSQARAWLKDNPTKDYIAVTNADFFGATCVNAFVKDGVILKSNHNSDLNDVPVSKPMMFGVSTSGARIAPMTEIDDYNKNLASYLRTNGFVMFKEDGQISYKGIFNTLQTGRIDENVTFLTTPSTKAVSNGTKVYKFKKLQEDKCKTDEVRGFIVADESGATSVSPTEEYGYMVVGKRTTVPVSVGDYFGTIRNSIISEDGLWNGYDTILGCRHSLLENGVIPSTVAKEDSNGAKSRVPRTAVGIMPDGKVVIVSVEDLHYNQKLSNAPSVCSGLNLSQLADFMRYFGCYDAANFDGGGSSQLITKVNGEEVVQTRSSDFGTYGLTESRPVLNTIIVTKK